LNQVGRVPGESRLAFRLVNPAAFRLERQFVSTRAHRGTAVETARRLCGVHAQVMSSADLILWARVEGHEAGALARLLLEKRSLVKTWLMRGTLHLVPADDLPLYVGALDNRGEYRDGWLRGFEVTAVQMERLIEAVGTALDGEPLTREELVAAVTPRVGKALAGRLRASWGDLLKPVARRGLLCSGPSRGQNVTFIRPERWLAGWREPPGRAEARAELLRRFLAAYGPATAGDFERWFGTTRRLKEPWQALDGDLAEVEPQTFVLDADHGSLKAARAWRGTRLLPGFDPYVLYPLSARPVPPASRDRVYRTAGWVSPTVIERGRVVGVWEPRRRGRAVTVRVAPFAKLAERTRTAVSREAAAVAAHLGGELDLAFE
jgi:hypothetical protein